MSAQADAFAALEHIEAGDWDRFLLRLRAAIDQRRRTDEYTTHVVAGQPLFGDSALPDGSSDE